MRKDYFIKHSLYWIICMLLLNFAVSESSAAEMESNTVNKVLSATTTTNWSAERSERVLLSMTFENDTENVICLPEIFFPMIRPTVGDFFGLVENGKKVAYKGIMMDLASPLTQYRIVRPGRSATARIFLDSGYAIKKGREYSLSYTFTGYDCSIFETGYPEEIGARAVSGDIGIYYEITTGDISFVAQ